MPVPRYIMANDHKIRNYDIVLDSEFGAPGTAEREASEQKAREYYSKENEWHTISVPKELYVILSKRAKDKGVSIRSYARQTLASVLL